MRKQITKEALDADDSDGKGIIYGHDKSLDVRAGLNPKASTA